MSKLDSVLLYQETEQKRQEIETAQRGTEAYRACVRLQSELKAGQAAVSKLSAELEQNTRRLEELVARSKKLEDRLALENDDWEIIRNDEESTSAEVTELYGDMDQVAKDLNGLTREIKRLFGEIEKSIESYTKTGNEYKAAKKSYDEYRAVVETERAEAQEKIAAIDEELKKIEATADPELLAKYKKAHIHYSDALVPVVQDKCGGCKMSIPTATLKKLEAEDYVVECENCGRVMYRPVG